MIKKLWLICLLLSLMSCVTSPVVKDKETESDIEQSHAEPTSDIFAFKVKEDIFLALNSEDVNYAVKLNTENISYKVMGHSLLIFKNDENIYQVNYAFFDSFLQIGEKYNSYEVLSQYYQYEKDYQEGTGGYVFDNNFFEIIDKNDQTILKWKYNPVTVRTKASEVIETRGYTIIENEKVISISMSITGLNNYQEKEMEFEDMLKMLIIFDEKLTDESISRKFTEN